MIIQKKTCRDGGILFFLSGTPVRIQILLLYTWDGSARIVVRRFYSELHFLCSKTLNGCRRKLVYAKIVLNVGKHLSRCTLLPIVECPFQFGHWRSFDLRLQIKIRNASLSLLIAFSATNGSKTSKIWRRKEFFY